MRRNRHSAITAETVYLTDSIAVTYREKIGDFEHMVTVAMPVGCGVGVVIAAARKAFAELKPPENADG